MKINPVTVILICVFLLPIIIGFLNKFSSYYLKRDLEDLEGNIAFIIALIAGLYFGKEIFIRHNGALYDIVEKYIPNNTMYYIEQKPIIIYLIIIPIIVFLIYTIITFILHAINNITFYPLIDTIEDSIKQKSNGIKRILGALFQIPKAICYVVILTVILNVISLFNIGDYFNKYLSNSKPYSYICKKVVVPVTNSGFAKKLPSIIDNSFKIQVKTNENTNTNTNEGINKAKGQIVYYNGVTLDEAVKSNSEIDNFSRKLVKNKINVLSKSKIFYEWIGKNIDYDHEKATRILSDDFKVESGAIHTFNTRSGICFDYSSLFVAMCRANEIKVRLITGKGYNGVSWVSHAWNQIYDDRSKTWVNVDTTFYKGGNYFNSRTFNFDHKEAEVAGEW